MVFNQVCDLPVRTAKFVARKNWVVTGSDDVQVRVFNYNTLERAHAFEAHSDYIRCIVVHPVQPYILTSSGMCLEFLIIIKIVIITNVVCF
jgi:coatomer subunit beta'